MKRSHSEPVCGGSKNHKKLSRGSVARLAGTRVNPHVRRVGDFLIGKIEIISVVDQITDLQDRGCAAVQ